MSIVITLRLDAASFDGTTFVPFSTFTFTTQGRNRFLGTLPAAQDLGIIDPDEIILGLVAQFGNLVDRETLHAGSEQDAVDYLLERTMLFNSAGAPVTPFEIGTQSGNTFFPFSAAGVRLRLVPEVMPTESAAMFQAGGSGQVAVGIPITPFALGQAGAVVLPNGMQIYVDGGDGPGDNEVAFWLTPFADPRTFLNLAQAGAAQPPPDFTP